MNRLRVFIAGAAFGALALAVVPLTGLIGHDATGQGVTGWYHWLAARQSVTLRSLTVPVPPLDDPAMARRAAGHYELVCASCHGSPTAPPARFAEDLWPAPPPLAEATARWRPDARVFQTVKYGIAHTAMPGWPVATRDDEVWDMVAFLRKLPQLSATDYSAMAGRATCTACHGERGEGRDGIPRLDIQSPAYLAAALRAYREGTRESGTMVAATRRLTDVQIGDLSARFGLEVSVERTGDGPAAQIASHGIPERDIPACTSCHDNPARPEAPSLYGQDARYLQRQLELFVELGEERGGPRAEMMAKAVRWLKPEEMEELSRYFGE